MSRFYWRFLLIMAIALASNSLSALQAAADDDTYSKVQELINDLGGPAQRKANNGKFQKCENGGTKRITITGDNYQGVYKNCKEFGRTRDGKVMITVGDINHGDSRPASNVDLAFEAVYNKDIVTLIRLLKKDKKLANKSISIPSNSGGETTGFTLLMNAATNADIEIVKLLVKYGADVNKVDSKKRTPLRMAADRGALDIVDFLISKKAKINVQDDTGVTPLFMAAYSGNADVVNLFIKYKADLNLKHVDGDTALFFAISNDHTPVALSLINAGANLNISNKYDVTPLGLAVDKGNLEVTKRLLESGAKEGFVKALYIASTKENKAMLELLSKYNNVISSP